MGLFDKKPTVGVLYETSNAIGISVKVFPDRVEYRVLGQVEVIPISQIASIRPASIFLNKVTIETSGGREYVLATGKKKEVVEAISRAQMAFRTPAAQPPISVADELEKLARLRAQGVLSDEEFAAQKKKLLG